MKKKLHKSNYILSLFFVVAVRVMIASLRVSKVNEHKIFAKHYADELYEWLSAEKELNWGGNNTDTTSFTYKASQLPYTFCFNTSPIAGWVSSSTIDLNSCPFTLNIMYRRYVTLTPLTVSETDAYIDKVNVSIIVEWTESGTVYRVPINSVFSIWEKTY